MGIQKLGELFVLYLPWIMLSLLISGIILRGVIYFALKRYEAFTQKLEKVIHDEIDHKKEPISFYVMGKKLLEKSYYEYFALREKYKRRKHDQLASLSDRIFMIRQGIAWFIEDTLKQMKALKWTPNDIPNFTHITRASFQKNPFFSRIAGLFPLAQTSDLTQILPGLFVVSGILGTFIGIAKGLPELSGMGISDIENSKLIMDRFLNEVAFAMRASILGITCSIIMNVYNTWLSPERLYVAINDRLDNVLGLLWHFSDDNKIPKQDDQPLAEDEMLAHQSLEKELLSHPRGRTLNEINKKKAS